MKVEAVIGANYGDEGKGLVTDWICAKENRPMVVLANGGSQRGHTVETKDGVKHVFHHFGAGALRGAPTYFAPSYLLNPMQFVKEYDELTALGREPVSFRHPDCVLQLPCDIALNWHLEKSRDERKHGSVGCGIWETKYRMYAGNAISLDGFCRLGYREKMKYVKDAAKKYRDVRCGEEGFSAKADIYDLFMSDGFLDHFISDCLFMRDSCAVLDSSDLESRCGTLVFENGQGLKLDQFYGAADEKNTTPSFTGSIGIARFLNGLKSSSVSSVTLNYVSRTYLTKHGAGAFAEGEDSSWFKDATNVRNEWQDEMRFAELDYDALHERCSVDFDMFGKTRSEKTETKKRIIMTHANEIRIPKRELDRVDFVSDSRYSSDIFAGGKK